MSASPVSDRAAALDAFLTRAGWSDATRHPLAGDASTRRYIRLKRGADSAMLMDAPPAAEAPACPPDADPAERRRLGYNAVARLAGGALAAFAGLARELHARGYSAPRVIAADFAAGYLLLEDLGDDLYARKLDAGMEAPPLYEAAVDLLGAVRRSTLPETVSFEGRAWRVLPYDEVALHAEADLLTEWYAQHRAGVRLDASAQQDWRALWAEAFAHLGGEARTLVLRDVHAENLIWLPGREGPARAGLLDFQDALFGHAAYDLASLLKDARRDVDAKLAEAMIARFIDVGAVDDADAFVRAYAILGAQRNAKILGIFVRLAHRDGKQRYLDFLPRTARLFLSDLDHPALADLKRFVHAQLPQLAEEARR